MVSGVEELSGIEPLVSVGSELDELFSGIVKTRLRFGDAILAGSNWALSLIASSSVRVTPLAFLKVRFLMRPSSSIVLITVSSCSEYQGSYITMSP